MDQYNYYNSVSTYTKNMTENQRYFTWMYCKNYICSLVEANMAK